MTDQGTASQSRRWDPHCTGPNPGPPRSPGIERLGAMRGGRTGVQSRGAHLACRLSYLQPPPGPSARYMRPLVVVHRVIAAQLFDDQRPHAPPRFTGPCRYVRVQVHSGPAVASWLAWTVRRRSPGRASRNQFVMAQGLNSR